MTPPEDYRNPGTHMVPQLATGAKAEPLPIEVIQQCLEGLRRHRGVEPAGEFPDRIRIGGFDWWRDAS